VTLLSPSTAPTTAQRRACANYLANSSALAITQPQMARALLPPREPVEWVFGRDGMLTALDDQGDWWSGCSLPRAAGEVMLRQMGVNAPVSCFLAPPHAAHLRIALDKLTAEQAVIAVVPEENDLRLLLSCEDFSGDFAAHRLWIAAGADWAATLESMLTQEIGLAVPGQFVRLHTTDEALIQQLIRQATAVFSRLTHLRSTLIAQISQGGGSSAKLGTLCVMAPLRFQLWHNEGAVLRALSPAGSIALNTSDPALASPLKLGEMASACGCLLAPNFARADLPDAIPMTVPWLTWLTQDRVPSFLSAGPRDQLLVAAPSLGTSAVTAGWPAARVHLACWPAMQAPPAQGNQSLAVIADTVPVETPADLEAFSSHRVLWETLRTELADDPFSLEGEPGLYLNSRMRRFDVSADAFPHERFLTQLIVPAYQQSVVRALCKAAVPIRLFGHGWDQIPEFQDRAVGALQSIEELEAAVAKSAVLVDLWPWRSAHPITSANRPLIRRAGRNLANFIQQARNVLANGIGGQVPATTPLSAKLIANLLDQ
jgi:hypothetical protein